MIAYVYPNTSEQNRKGRGGLRSRSELARSQGCALVEMPADFIKNKTEASITGLDLGEPLSENAVAQIYEAGSPSPSLPYILHSEPSLPRSDGHGLSRQVPLQWYRPEWAETVASMLVAVGARLESPPAVVEIHPGDTRNSIKDVVRSARVIADRLEEAFSFRPRVMLENRTGQFLSTGKGLADLARHLEREHSAATALSIVLDVQQLYTVTRRHFLEELEAVPKEYVTGLHIHSKHRCPHKSDEIPWAEVFAWIRALRGDILLNPEVHHRAQVAESIQFCESMRKGAPNKAL